ncbi:hypothetical protein E8L99_18550 [Phreatobacter aquaticus]|uniref:Uncharacterized protein n=1 Tax=Phreatobacter aquaticus TaxID=2570229 RepID=A0A4D7QKQ2_9HYPH|nr:hypothetical protein [Phreatobacter aquaticus]QCK87615.1 hypothetical protein E8L99_18550 [Phreatobacter aquaticus]
MNSYQANSSSPSNAQSDECVEALVRWRLADPAWLPSFQNLLDDVRTCIDMNAGPPLVLSALMSVLKSHPELASRARLLAEEARGSAAARIRKSNGNVVGFAQRLLNSLRPASPRI